MQQISLRNVKQNNLQIDRLQIPLEQLILFVGPSGSGKSSLAIDTILAEGQRRCIEALRSSIQLDDKRPSRPKVEAIEGLPPTFGMRQDIGVKFHSHTNISDVMGVQSLFEHLFLQHGVLHCPHTDQPLPTYSANDATTYLLDHHQGFACYIVANIPIFTQYQEIIHELMRNGHSRIQYDDAFYLIEEAPTKPPTKLGIVIDRLKIRDNNRDRIHEAIRRCLTSHTQQAEVIIQAKGAPSQTFIFSKLPIDAQGNIYALPTREHLQSRSSSGSCVHCHGTGEAPHKQTGIISCEFCKATGLGEYASILKVDGTSFQAIMRKDPSSILRWLEDIPYDTGETTELQKTLALLGKVQIKNPLCQKMNTLSTGERSRIRTCSVLNQELGQCLYVLDEPSLGLDDTQVQHLIDLLREYLAHKQSFIVVDHHPLFQDHADCLFHFGPGSGVQGGTILDYPPNSTTIDPSEFVPKSFSSSFVIPTSKFVVHQGAIHMIAGASGTGKTTLLHQLHQYTKAHRLEKSLLLSHLGSLGNKRSTLVTIINMWSEIRNLMASTTSAKLHRLTAADFSFNRKGGRCDTCHGLGSIPFHVPPLPPTEVTCDTCRGKRFLDNTLKATYRDHDISDILNLSIDEALKLFANQPSIFRQCQALQMVGLGYLTLGQTSPTLSGGEHRRIQLAQILAPCLKPEYAREPMIVFLDDPTAALHASDARRLQRVFLNLRQEDITIIMTSNNTQMLEVADFITRLS